MNASHGQSGFRLPLFLASALIGASLVVAGEAGAAASPAQQLWEGSAEQKAYSEFNHHLSGVFLLVIAGLFLLKEQGVVPRRWLTLWPLSLLLLGGYLVIWSDRFAWPIGPAGFFESLTDPETVQHKLYAVVLVALGSLEWARLRGRLPRLGSALFFGIVAFAGLLMFHHSLLMAHNHHSPKLLSNHLLVGALTIGAGGAKLTWEMGWMKWRHGGLLWPACVLVLGVLLVFYSE
jgi:putative copper resistance protein D